MVKGEDNDYIKENMNNLDLVKLTHRRGENLLYTSRDYNFSYINENTESAISIIVFITLISTNSMLSIYLKNNINIVNEVNRRVEKALIIISKK
ncbi:hypothetical protein U3516DRAFT_733647 [Neocallimastix sp. 'constans']